MNILLAPDSYKGSLTSVQVAGIMKRAISTLNYDGNTVSIPMADGGEGTVDTLLSSMRGKQVALTCKGPLGEKIDTYYAILPDGTAVIEIANIAGLTQVPISKQNPTMTTSYGLGEAIVDALDKGCESLVIGLGGSVTNDGGLGMLLALGMKAWRADGQLAGIFGGDVWDIKKVSFTDIDARVANTSIKIACDVNNPLYGYNGASKVYGSQKGATEEQMIRFDNALADFSKIIEKELGQVFHDRSGSGAAGGLGFAMLVLGSELVSGSELVASASDLENYIEKVDFVITGEGKTDQQTLNGKVPKYIAEVARSYNIPTVLISGSLDGDVDKLQSEFAGCFSILQQPLTVQECIEDAEELLYNQTRQIIHFIYNIRPNIK